MEKVRFKGMMNAYNVILTRTYQVEINAGSEEEAKGLCEYFLGGDLLDLSTQEEKEKYLFSFGEIEMLLNDSTEVEEVVVA
ncbi:MAG: hypothetical protein H7A23_18485 [Leptospiraceae bacterium]|nr:hypothetical protein [Leptospiraceae bacterium]